MKREIGIWAAVAALSLVGLAKATTLYSNGFESGDPGASDFYDSTTGIQGANIAVVANGGGALGLIAPQGTHYAEITNTDEAYDGLGDGESTYTDYGAQANNNDGIVTNGAFYESTAYYINTDWAAPTAAYSPAFWIDTTPSTDPGYLDETNFRVSVPGNGTVNVAGFVGNPGSNGAVASITSSGWYTFKTTFVDDGGFVSNTLSVLDSLGNLVGSYTGDTTLPFADLTGTGYGDWTTVWQDGFGATIGEDENGAADVLAIDDVEVGTVPLPSSAAAGLALLTGLGLFGGLRRRRWSV